MFVGYDPPPIDFAQADRKSEIQALLLTVRTRFSATHRRDDKRDIPAGGDTHFRNVEGDRIARPGKNKSHVFL